MENKAVTQNPGQEAPKKENKVLNTIVNIVLVLVILFAVFVGYSAYVTKAGSGVPSFLGIRVFAIQSDSMVPTFSKGDLVIAKAVKDPAELKEGDIISFWTVIQGERVINTHRIIGISDGGTFLSFTTKGDNNTIEDAMTVHQAEIVGKYLFSIPKLGSFLDFLQTSKGFLICIVIPVALFFIYYVVQFFRALFAYQAEKTRLKLEAMYASQHPEMQIYPSAPAEPAANSPPASETKAESPKEEKKEEKSSISELEVRPETAETTVIEEKTEEVIEEITEEPSAEKPKKKKKVIKKVIVYEEVEDDDDSADSEETSIESEDKSAEPKEEPKATENEENK